MAIRANRVLWLVACFAIAAAPSAAAAEGNLPSGDDGPFLIVGDERNTPSELSFEKIPDDYSDALPYSAEVAHALSRIEFQHAELGFSGSEWDEQSAKVNLYATAPEREVQQVLALYGVEDQVVYQQAIRDRREKDALVRKLIGFDGNLASGHRIATVTPSLDGSEFDVVLDESHRGFGEPVLADTGARLNVSYGPAPEAITRVHAPNPLRFSGAFMQNGVNGCTSGLKFQDTNGSTNVPTMVSAHHCGKVVWEPWYYSTGTANSIGEFRGSFGSLVSTDLAYWKGTGVSDMLAAIFIGNNTVAGSTLHAIRGAAAPTVNAVVCHSGAFSGTVCGNKITATGIGVCYSGLSWCYIGINSTEQVDATPAAGNGDSGGPVYQAISGYPYAAGIISGILYPDPACTGDPGSASPGGRKCSAFVYYAPLYEPFAYGYALEYFPLTS